MKVNLDRIIENEKAGKIRVQSHPDLPLFIANYTEQCTFKRQWDDLTMMCRGLIFDADGTIVARPFKKFFNLGEGMEPEKPAPPPPDEPFEVTEKMDGSLGIVFYNPLSGQWDLASRGSFTSEQADTGRRFLCDLMDDRRMDKSLTYCVEIVYPENRIVVDYGSDRNLYVLAAIDIETGEDREFEDFGFPRVRKHGPFNSFTEFIASLPEGTTRDDLGQRLRASSTESRDGEVRRGVRQLPPGEDVRPDEVKEGFVLHFQSGLRLKLKTTEYVRLHRLVTGVNSRRIWECLSAGQNLDDLLLRVPEEFAQWVTSERDRLVKEHATISEAVRRTCETMQREAAHAVGVHSMDIATSIGAGREMRKEFALRAARHPAYSGLLFAAYDGADIEPLVWKLLRPETVETPYAPAREG